MNTAAVEAGLALVRSMTETELEIEGDGMTTIRRTHLLKILTLAEFGLSMMDEEEIETMAREAEAESATPERHLRVVR